MSLQKKYSKKHNLCRVKFTVPAEIAKDFKTANLLGDFNNWDLHADKMRKSAKDGSFSITKELETGREYSFRYLLNGEHWINEPDADKHVLTHFGDSENSVVFI